MGGVTSTNNDFLKNVDFACIFDCKIQDNLAHFSNIDKLYNAIFSDFNHTYSFKCNIKQVQKFLQDMQWENIFLFHNELKKYENMKLDFYIFSDDISVKNRAYLKRIAKEFHFANIIFINPLQNKITQIWDKIKDRNHFSKEIFYKLLASDIIDNDKIIITDVDVVFTSCLIDGFLDFNTNDKIAAILPNIKQETPKASTFLKTKGWKRNYGYYKQEWLERCINGIGSGYFIINKIRWQKEELESKMLDFAMKYAHILVLPEQDILNIFAYDSMFALSQNYIVLNHIWRDFGATWEKKEVGFYNFAALKDARIFPIQLHFVGPKKPWLYPNVPFGDVWFKFMLQTPFCNDYLNEIGTLVSKARQISISRRVKRYIFKNPFFIFKFSFYEKVFFKIYDFAGRFISGAIRAK